MNVNRAIRASDFEATCRDVIDDVADHGCEYVITRRGRPVARIIPMRDPVSIRGSICILTDDETLLFSTADH